VTLSGSIRNLFDRAYADPGSAEHRQNVIPQDGRSFRIGLEWQLGSK
jgi:iron complex outermembrane receptor protein